MDLNSLKFLNSQGVKDPICENCMSEDVTEFIVLRSQVLYCNHCLRLVKYHLKSERFTPKLDLRLINSEAEAL